MDKEKRELLSGVIYDYVDSLNIPEVHVDIIGEGQNSLSVAITVTDGCKDDVDETEIYNRVAKEHSLDDVDISFTCYEESEFDGGFEDTEDPDAGVGDEDLDEEDEIKADRLNVRSNPNEDDPVFDGEEEEDEEEDTDFDPESFEDGYEEEEEEEEYEPTWEDWDDVKDFYSRDDE